MAEELVDQCLNFIPSGLYNGGSWIVEARENPQVPYLSKRSVQYRGSGLFLLDEGEGGNREILAGNYPQEITLLEFGGIKQCFGKTLLVGAWTGCALQSLLQNEKVEEITILEPYSELAEAYFSNFEDLENAGKVKNLVTGDMVSAMVETLKDSAFDSAFINLPRPLPSPSFSLALIALSHLMHKHNVIKPKGRLGYFGKRKMLEFINAHDCSTTGLAAQSFPLFYMLVLQLAEQVVNHYRALNSGEKKSAAYTPGKIVPDEERCQGIPVSLGGSARSLVEDAIASGVIPDSPIGLVIKNYIERVENCRVLIDDSAFLLSGFPDNPSRIVFLVNQYLESVGMPALPVRYKQDATTEKHLSEDYGLVPVKKEGKDTLSCTLTALFSNKFAAEDCVLPAGKIEWNPFPLSASPKYLEETKAPEPKPKAKPKTRVTESGEIEVEAVEGAGAEEIEVTPVEANKPVGIGRIKDPVLLLLLRNFREKNLVLDYVDEHCLVGKCGIEYVESPTMWLETNGFLNGTPVTAAAIQKVLPQAYDLILREARADRYRNFNAILLPDGTVQIKSSGLLVKASPLELEVARTVEKERFSAKDGGIDMLYFLGEEGVLKRRNSASSHVETCSTYTHNKTSMLRMGFWVTGRGAYKYDLGCGFSSVDLMQQKLRPYLASGSVPENA